MFQSFSNHEKTDHLTSRPALHTWRSSWKRAWSRGHSCPVLLQGGILASPIDPLPCQPLACEALGIWTSPPGSCNDRWTGGIGTYRALDRGISLEDRILPPILRKVPPDPTSFSLKTLGSLPCRLGRCTMGKADSPHLARRPPRRTLASFTQP